jgi:hypothetical protein
MVRLVLTALLLLAAPSGVLAGPRSETYHQAKATTVLVVAINDSTHSISLGSGFFVDQNGLLVTNAHVVEDHSRLLIYVRDQEIYSSPQLVVVDADADLAAIRVPVKEQSPSLALAQTAAEDGEEVIAVGYPRITDILQMGFVLHPTIVTGHATGLAQGRSRTTGHITPFIQTTGPFNFGNSGGPLVSLESREIQGMVVHTVPYLERAKDRSGNPIGNVMLKSGIGYSIPASVIREWLARNSLLPKTTAVTVPPDQESATTQVDTSRSFATGHLLHTLAMVLQSDTDLLGLAAFHYQNAAAVRPTMPSVMRNLGLVSAALGQWDKALAAYQQALQQMPKDPALLVDTGLAWERTGNRERAIELYRAALQVNPRSELAHNNLGSLLLKMGRLDDAINEFRLALNCESGSAMASYNLGLALEAKGLRDDALTAWETFLRKPGQDSAGFNTKMREGVARLKSTVPKARPVSGITPP